MVTAVSRCPEHTLLIRLALLIITGGSITLQSTEAYGWGGLPAMPAMPAMPAVPGMPIVPLPGVPVAPAGMPGLPSLPAMPSPRVPPGVPGASLSGLPISASIVPGGELVNAVITAGSQAGGKVITDGSAVLSPVLDTVWDTALSIPLVDSTVDALADVLIVAKLYTSAKDPGTVIRPQECQRSGSAAIGAFDPKKPTKIIVHGYLSNAGASTGLGVIKDALFTLGDFNVILYDWSLFDTKVYPISVEQVDVVGRRMARDVIAMAETVGLQPSSIHLIGHSLGAHICGWAGLNIAKALGEPVWEITGLDAAGPSYYKTSNPRKLTCKAAKFVWNIHTDGGLLGMAEPCACLDVWVFSGLHPQPNCKDDVSGVCSHCYAFPVYIGGLLNDSLVATKCSSFADCQAKRCEGEPKTSIGLKVDRGATGNYYLSTDISTSNAFTYCLGVKL